MRTPEQEFAVRCLGGHPTGLDASIFVIEADGECQSLNGSHILCDRWFPSLPDALDLLTTEFPDDEATPCPADDMILIWEVRTDGFRKLAWCYFGSNYQGLTYASPPFGQGRLPGQTTTPYARPHPPHLFPK